MSSQLLYLFGQAMEIATLPKLRNIYTSINLFIYLFSQAIGAITEKGVSYTYFRNINLSFNQYNFPYKHLFTNQSLRSFYLDILLFIYLSLNVNTFIYLSSLTTIYLSIQSSDGGYHGEGSDITQIWRQVHDAVSHARANNNNAGKYPRLKIIKCLYVYKKKF